MRRLLLGMLAITAIGCGTTASPAAAPSLFSDVVLGDVSEFGADATVTELIEPRDLVVVGATPDPVVFWRKDPNNGCRLGLAADLSSEFDWVDELAVFVDQCHGNQYDLAGRPVADSASNPMHTIPTEVRDGALVWTRDDVREAVEASLTEG